MKGFSKQNALLVILIGTLLIGLSVSVSAPVAISKVDGYDPRLSMPSFSYDADGNLTEDPVFGFAEITVINVQSYPQLGSLWDVHFTTVGTADLIINAIQGTVFGVDIIFKSLFCGSIEVTNDSPSNYLLFPNFNCSEEATLSNLVLTTGKHALEFLFGTATANAFNQAWTSTTAADFNSGTGYDFNHTKVTSDGNVMPSGELYIPDRLQPGGGLVGYWKLDQNLATVAPDSSGQGNDGTWTNGADSNGAWFFDQNAGFFDGVNDYIDLGEGDNLAEGLNALTVSTWFKNDLTSNDGWRFIVGQEWVFGLRWLENERFDFLVSNGSTWGIATSGSTYTDTDWHHITGVYDGTTVQIYIDGVAADSTPATYTDTLNTTAANVSIGRYGSTNNYYFNGQIAEVKIFDRALSEQEIQNEYNRNLDGNGLVAYYNFNDTNSDGSAILNQTGNDDTNGILMGGADINAAGMWDTNALFLDGVNEHLVVGNSLEISTAVTETAWLKFPNGFSKSTKKQDFTLLDAGSHKLYLDHTSGKLAFEAVNKTQGSWAVMPNDPNYNSFLAFGTYDGNLFVGTYGVVGDGDIWTFDGTNWSMSYDGTKAGFFCFVVYDGNLWAGQGTSTASNGDIYTFDGTTWSLGLDAAPDRAESMSVYDGNLFVGFGTGTGDRQIWTYDGTTWMQSLDLGNGTIWALVPYDGNLYAGDVNVHTFDGTTWSTSLERAVTLNGFYSLAVYDGNLFAGTGVSGGDGDIYTFDGANWNLSYNGARDVINSLVVYDGNLFAGIGDDAGENDILTYDGTTWSTAYDGTCANNACNIYDLIVYDGNLFAGEGYSTIGDGNVLTFGNGFSVSSTTSSWNANQWYEVAATYDGAIASIYVNGMLENTKTKSILIDNQQNNLFSNKAFIGRAIGSSRTGGDTGFLKGSLEELKVYDRALTASEIQQDYNAWMKSSYYSPIKDAGKTANWQTMQWNETTDENNSITVDYRGCSTASCSTAGDWQTGLKGGNTIQTISNADENQYFQYKVNFDTNKQNWNPYRNGDTDKGNYAKLSNITITYVPDPNIDVNIWRIDGHDTTKAMPSFSYATDGNLTIDFNIATDSNYGKHYADLNYSTTNTQGSGTPIVQGLKVDGNYCQTNFIQPWDNTAGSDVNLVGYWKFDAQEDDYNSIQAFDYSGNGHHAQYVAGADNNGDGKWDTNASFFDGVDDYIQEVTYWTWKDQNAMSVCAWVKTEGSVPINTTATIIRHGNVANGRFFWLYWGQNQNVDFVVYNISGTTALGRWTDGITEPGWYRVCGTYDGWNTKVFINGIIGGTIGHVMGPLEDRAGLETSGQDKLVIGADKTYTGTWGNGWNGNIDEIKLYNRTLSPSEISMDYGLGLLNHRSCSYDWNISGIADANYYASVLAYDDAGHSDFNASANSFHVNPSGEPPEDSCSCPASGNWEIINSDNCKLTTPCRVTGNVNVINGSLEVDTGAGGRLFVPKEYKIHGSKANGKLTWGK